MTHQTLLTIQTAPASFERNYQAVCILYYDIW